MKKLFAIVAVLGLLGTTQVAAQTEDVNNVQQTEAVEAASESAAVEAPAVEEPVAEEPAEAAPVEVVEEEGIAGVHKTLKTKFIEGGAEFMALVAIAMVIGLAFCVERIIYLSMAQVNTKKLMASIADALSKNDVEAAKEAVREHITNQERGIVRAINDR